MISMDRLENSEMMYGNKTGIIQSDHVNADELRGYIGQSCLSAGHHGAARLLRDGIQLAVLFHSRHYVKLIAIICGHPEFSDMSQCDTVFATSEALHVN